jgi:hypothetical protein
MKIWPDGGRQNSGFDPTNDIFRDPVSTSDAMHRSPRSFRMTFVRGFIAADALTEARSDSS